MFVPRRPLALAAAINLCVVVGAATAQTVIVTKAPPGSTIELALNADTVASTTVNADGTATLTTDMTAHGLKPETEALIYLDTCTNRELLTLIEPGMQAPAVGDTCTRLEVPGLYLLRKVTSFVIDLGSSPPTVRFRQGSVPSEWLSQEPAALRASRPTFDAPKGLQLFGGWGFTHFGRASTVACGGVGSCTGSSTPMGFGGGVAVWITPYLGAEAGFVKPGDVTVTADETIYRFTSVQNTQVLILVGKLGIPLGRVRIYGEGGMNHHQSTRTTNEFIPDSTVTIDDVAQTIPGGIQSFELRTAGWSWTFGGGMEIWLSRAAAVYVDFGRARLKGPIVGGQGEGAMDDHLTYVLIGGRFHIGR